MGEINRAAAQRFDPGSGVAPYPVAPYPVAPEPPGDAAPSRAPSWVSTPIDRSVTYREACSEFPWRLVVGCLGLFAVLIWGITVSPAWLVGVIAVLLVVPVILFVGSLIFLPYGIRLEGGTLWIGARAVPRIGRGWKRQQLPLEEVIAWTVCSRSDASKSIPRSPFADGDLAVPPADKRVGNWGNFTGPGVRDVLVVRVDPARVPAAMPAVVMMGAGVEDARRTARDIGVYVIGTRRPQRLAQALERAMPSRRSLT